jgi:hypothetical protein
LKNGARVDQTQIQFIKGKIEPTFAVVKDGEWYEKGNMGWWAIVSDEKKEKAWHKEFHSLLKGLPKKTVVTLVDAHI